MKFFMILMLLAVLGALAGAGVFMLKRGNQLEDPLARDRRMARVLAIRVALSVALFLLLLLGWLLGWIKPSGIPIGI